MEFLYFACSCFSLLAQSFWTGCLLMKFLFNNVYSLFHGAIFVTKLVNLSPIFLWIVCMRRPSGILFLLNLGVKLIARDLLIICSFRFASFFKWTSLFSLEDNYSSWFQHHLVCSKPMYHSDILMRIARSLVYVGHANLEAYFFFCKMRLCTILFHI